MHTLNLLSTQKKLPTSVVHMAWNNSLHEVKEELERISSQRVKVYQTFVENECKYVFITTSKDIHLWLGTFSSNFHASLASLLGIEIEANNVCGQFLFYVDDMRVFLVTRTSTNDGCMVFTLSPAH